MRGLVIWSPAIYTLAEQMVFRGSSQEYNPTFVAEAYFSDGKSLLGFTPYNGFSASEGSAGGGSVSGMGLIYLQLTLRCTQ